MSDSKPAGPQSANTASGETARTAKIIPKPSEENISQNPFDANAPPQCEMCDADVPDVATRTAHMAQTEHCACNECYAYVPPGRLYSHWSTAHANLTWNDHAVAWTDRMNVRSAMPWAREAWEKAVGMTVDGVPIANT
jgi:hypothetical protein